MKKIIAIGIIGMFLLTGMAAVSAFNLEETEIKSNQSLMINLTDYDPVVKLNDAVSFEISVSDSNGEPASFCNYEVYTRPSEEDISCQRVGDKIVGEFTATRTGMYSLIVEVADGNNCVEKESFYYFVNPNCIGIGNIRYYFRDDLPTHGQPIGNGGDCGSLLLTPPTEKEYRNCSSYVQFSPDEIPENPISILTNVDIYCWYKFFPEFRVRLVPYRIGIQKVANCSFAMDISKHVPALVWNYYSWINRDFSIFWAMDNPSDWYWLSLKLRGCYPSLLTKPEQPSYADFTYIYCKTPNIKSISNADIIVLSATSQSDNTNNAQIILQGTGATNLVIQMPDDSRLYTATFNGVKCDFTQANGELTFNLQLDSEQTEHSLDIYPGQSGTISQQFQ
ncbi:MAG: hypothetical protein NTV74_04035 [Euryarchaeota archaeon]|nr:hypothetical protein [Euryarchaeota archaeon]